MKITIDTKEDSHEEIRNIIKMLTSLVGNESRTNQTDIFEDSSPTVEPKKQDVFGNIFGDNRSSVKEEPEKDEKVDIDVMPEQEEPKEEVESAKDDEDDDPSPIIKQYF